MLGDGFWRSYFGADPDVVGALLQLDRTPHEIVGVLPPGFRLQFPSGKGVPESLDVYVPYPPLQDLTPNQFYLRTIARLRPGTTVQEAQTALSPVAMRLRGERPELADSDVEFEVRSLQREWTNDLRPAVLGVQLAGSLLLVLTLANVTSLTIASTTSRLPELAVRSCLGAAKNRIGRQLAVEALALSVTGTILGVALGAVGLNVLWRSRPLALHRLADVTPETNVIALALATCALSSLFLTIGPLLLLRRTRRSMHLWSRGHVPAVGRRLRRVASVAQVAAAFSLVVGAVLLAHTVANLRSVDPGFETNRRFAFTIGIPLQMFPADPDRGRVVQEIVDRVAAIPGVDTAGAGSHLPLGQWVNWAAQATPAENPEDPRNQQIVDHRAVSPGYFAALGRPLHAGREFLPEDDLTNSPVVIVDTVLAERLFGDADPLDREILVSAWRDFGFSRVAARVVGVSKAVRDRSPHVESSGHVYLPWAQTPRWEVGIVLAATNADSLEDAVRGQLALTDQRLAVADFRPMTQDYSNAIAPATFTLLLAVIVAIAAIVLSAVGIHGVLQLETLSRYREIGIRLALGARRGQVTSMIVGSGLRLVVAGLALGVPLAVGLTGLVSTLLYGVDQTSPGTYLPAALIIAVVATSASAFPARRAARCEPAQTLRGDTTN